MNFQEQEIKEELNFFKSRRNKKTKFMFFLLVLLRPVFLIGALGTTMICYNNYTNKSGIKITWKDALFIPNESIETTK